MMAPETAPPSEPGSVTVTAAPSVATMPRWSDIEPVLREYAYRAIDNDPEVLLEGDGGPYVVQADLIYARLLGFDDEIVRDGWRLQRIEPDLRLPIIRRVRMMVEEPEPSSLVMPVARYVLQSGFARQHVDVQTAPDVLDLLPAAPADFMVKVLYLRYRRRD